MREKLLPIREEIKMGVGKKELGGKYGERRNIHMERVERCLVSRTEPQIVVK